MLLPNKKKHHINTNFSMLIKYLEKNPCVQYRIHFSFIHIKKIIQGLKLQEFDV